MPQNENLPHETLREAHRMPFSVPEDKDSVPKHEKKISATTRFKVGFF